MSSTVSRVRSRTDRRPGNARARLTDSGVTAAGRRPATGPTHAPARWSRAYPLAAGLAALVIAACASEAPEPTPPAVEPTPPIFRDVALETGLDFRHFTGSSGAYYLPEIMGAGVALFDYDTDGDLDVYLLQGTMLGPPAVNAETALREPGDEPGHRLFRNELSESGRLGFVDVTDQAGVGLREYGMGVAVGDIDNDGHPDLYVTAFGRNVLYRNNGDGSFADITDEAEVDDGRWSASASFLDYDRDGDLDLFVTNYVDFTVRNHSACYGVEGMRDYCNPTVYRPVPDRLFRNRGDGTFEDVSASAGINTAFGSGLGVIAADFNADSWPDFYIANDGNANQLWQNNRDGTFSNVALLAGTAYNANGEAEGGMGVAAGDADGDGDEDLFVSHLAEETNTLYVNGRAGAFRDGTLASGLAATSVGYTGFGCQWFDYDHDGWPDLFVANGAVSNIESLRDAPYPFSQRNQLFRGLGDGRFAEMRDPAGSALELVEVSRGSAFGDIDNDGDIDVVVSNNNGPVRLLVNDAGAAAPSLSLRLEGVESNREGIGARVALLRADRDPVWRRVHRDGSYLSASDARVHFGLGDEGGGAVEGVGVVWPNGRRERWERADLDAGTPLREGSGRPWPADS